MGAANKTNFTCRISNAAQFLGTMDVQNAYESDGVPWGKMWLELGNTTVGGSLIMGADTQLSGIADETTTGFTVASLTLKTGSVLDLTRGGLTVTQSLTVESTPFTVKVGFFGESRKNSPTPIPAATTTAMIMIIHARLFGFRAVWTGAIYAG